MVKRIIWTKKANNRFNKIIDYLESEWGENVTRSFVQRSYEVIELIAERPDIGALRIKK